jgi:hypothetical protein
VAAASGLESPSGIVIQARVEGMRCQNRARESESRQDFFCDCSMVQRLVLPSEKALDGVPNLIVPGLVGHVCARDRRLQGAPRF